MIDETHDPDLESWVESANEPGCDFPLQNLPLAVFKAPNSPAPRIGTAIGDFIFDASDWVPGQTLNAYMALPQSQRRDIRHLVSKALRKGAPRCSLFAQSECELMLPALIGDYTDFYASIHHATNVGKMFRPDNPLLPNYTQVPIAYHGRTSSIMVSGSSLMRPNGQLAEGVFGPTQELDYELELGVFLGPGNELGQPLPIAEASRHVAGICLLE